MLSKLTGERGMLRQVIRVLQGALRDGVVEQYYSAASLAERLEVTERTVWNYVELYETSGGKEGIGPVVKLSHKVVRIPASAANRFLKSRRIELERPDAGDAKEDLAA
jgi:DNA-binding Lrp family transcriptional regulator